VGPKKNARPNYGTRAGYQLTQRQSGLQDHFNAVVFLVEERVIALRGLAQFKAMRDDETRIDLAALDPVKQAFPIMLHMALPCSHGEAAIHE